MRCVTGISQWRRCCRKGTINILNVIRCPEKRFQSSKLWEIQWSWSKKVGWDGGMGLRWDECGLEGLPPVVVTPFGQLGVGSNHHVEAASLAGCASAMWTKTRSLSDLKEFRWEILLSKIFGMSSKELGLVKGMGVLGLLVYPSKLFSDEK